MKFIIKTNFSHVGIHGSRNVRISNIKSNLNLFNKCVQSLLRSLCLWTSYHLACSSHIAHWLSLWLVKWSLFLTEWHRLIEQQTNAYCCVLPYANMLSRKCNKLFRSSAYIFASQFLLHSSFSHSCVVNQWYSSWQIYLPCPYSHFKFWNYYKRFDYVAFYPGRPQYTSSVAKSSFII